MSNLACYTIGYDFVTSTNQWFPCGTPSSSSEAVGCCYAGDFCMADGICHYVHTVTGGSEYYLNGCTDPTWQDSACPKTCASNYGGDVVYVSDTNSWDCCESSPNGPNCSNPSPNLVYLTGGPSPDQLGIVSSLTETVPSATLTTAIGSISTGQSTSAASSSSTTATSSSASSSQSTPTSTSTSTSSNTAAAASSTTSAASTVTKDGSSSLSGGAKAGIAVGVVVFALLVIGALALLFFRRTGAKKAQYGDIGGTPPNGSGYHDAPKQEMYAPAGGYEMDHVKPPQELPAQREAVELPGGQIKPDQTLPAYKYDSRS